MTLLRKWMFAAMAASVAIIGCGEKPMESSDSMVDQLNAAKKMPQDEAVGKKSSMDKIDKGAPPKGN